MGLYGVTQVARVDLAKYAPTFVDCDATPALCAEHNVMSFPTIMNGDKTVSGCGPGAAVAVAVAVAVAI